MKKLLTYLLTFAMLIVVLIPAMEPASAADTNSQIVQGKITDERGSIPVYATVEAPDMPDVFYVELSWGSMLFEIKDTGSRSYDPTNMQYTYSSAESVIVGPKTDGANTFRLENKSNYPVTGYCEYSDNASQLEGTFTGDVGTDGMTFTLAEVADGVVSGNPVRTADITLNLEATNDFKMKSTTDPENEIGSITVYFRDDRS